MIADDRGMGARTARVNSIRTALTAKMDIIEDDAVPLLAAVCPWRVRRTLSATNPDAGRLSDEHDAVSEVLRSLVRS